MRHMILPEHNLEYAKSGRSRCHGTYCRENIPLHALRYGKKYTNPTYGDSYSWYHWECASFALPSLAKARMDQVLGFCNLKAEDQQRVRSDISARRISAVPSNSQTSAEPPSSSQPASSQSHTSQETSSRGQKRKRTQETEAQQANGHRAAVTDENEQYFDASEDEAKDELYVTLSTKIVGTQYYDGLVGNGEEVALVREPSNQYDNNAIRVLNIAGNQVGHIVKTVAGKLAPLMDANQVAVEGVIPEGGSSTEYSKSLTLRIYGASHRRQQLERLLVWATPKQRGFTDAMRRNLLQELSPMDLSQTGTGLTHRDLEAQQRRSAEIQRAAELKSLLSSLEKVDDEGRRASLLDIVCPTEDLLNMPTYPNPPSVANGQLRVDLLRHQSQALQWCIERENPALPQKETDRPVQFWQYKFENNKRFYLNLVTHTPQLNPPELGRGGLMADAMGLGKTLTMLALVAATKADVPTEDFSNATLIVVPVSVLFNWETQINEHFTHGSLTYHVYHEAGRLMSSEELATYNVVITAYPTVTADFASKEGVAAKNGGPKKKRLDQGLFGVKWKRIILDEGHTIRNPKAKMSVAVKKLEGERRWVVSGTPIINSPKDLGSLLEFLRICHPLDKDEYYKRLIMRPISQGAPQGAELLKALMSHICIRRTKEMQNEKGEYLVPLPPVEMTIVPIKLDEATRILYDEVEALSKARFATSMMDIHLRLASSSMPSNVLSLLTRLRQLALHPALVPKNYIEQLRAKVSETNETTEHPPAMPVTPDDRVRLQGILARAIEDSEECPICFEICSNEPRITPCAHIFCLACIKEVISRDPRCPMDRRTIYMSDLILPLPPTDATQLPPPQEDVDDDGSISSPKIDQLIHLLQLTPKNEKSLVFSQFTSFLDKIAGALDYAGIPYVRFDGQMSAGRRQKVLEQFSQPLQESENVESAQVIPGPSTSRSTRVARSKRKLNSYIDDDEPNGKDDGFVPSDQGDEDDPFEDFQDKWSKKGKGKSKGKGKEKGKHQANGKGKSKMGFNHYASEVNPAVMLISLKAGALGLNLTVANNVYLMDPWWQEGIESQAIDRCNRIGQTKSVHVYQLVAENTVEAKVLEIQERKKKLIIEAMSGLRSTETQRIKKQARVQDLIELFGARRNDNSQNTNSA